jgi:single-stranded-DNA-specific exonuclease
MFYKVKNKPISLPIVESLHKELELPFLLSAMLSARGIQTMDDAATFLTCSYDLFNPFLLKDMNKAVERIEKAIRSKESIYVVGDFDVDGITSTAILLRFFDSIDYPIFNKLPTQKEGHGLSVQGVEYVKSQKGTLIITVDNGSTSYDAVNLAVANKIDVIITDHHDISKEGLPNAFAIINPKQEDCLSPFKLLSGGGLALYLVRAIAERLGYENKVTADLFVLAAISTIADVAPLKEDNRRIVKAGLDNLQNSGIIGLALLLEEKRAGKSYGARDVAFNIAPVINAAGKFGYGEDALAVLAGKNYIELTPLVKKLLGINDERKEIVKKVIPDLIKQADEGVKQGKLVLMIQGNHPSAISGLMASRLAEQFQKPVIVVSFLDGETEGRASCRSIDGFNLQEAIEDLKEFHLGGGGHYMAAGFSMEKNQFEDFERLINVYAIEKMKNKAEKTWSIDGEFSIEQVSQKMFAALQLLEPYGAKNEAPLLKVRGIKFKQTSYNKWMAYSTNIGTQIVKVHSNLDAQIGKLITGKAINAIIEIVFQDGQPILIVKDFEE